MAKSLRGKIESIYFCQMELPVEIVDLIANADRQTEIIFRKVCKRYQTFSKPKKLKVTCHLKYFTIACQCESKYFTWRDLERRGSFFNTYEKMRLDQSCWRSIIPPCEIGRENIGMDIFVPGSSMGEFIHIPAHIAWWITGVVFLSGRVGEIFYAVY